MQYEPEDLRMKTNFKKSYITVPIILAVALILVISATFALFTESSSGTRQFTLSNFTSSVEVSFDDFSTTASGTTLGGATYYTVDWSDSNSANFIGNLRVRVNYAGKGVGLLRVRIAEEWSKTSDGVTTVKPYTIHVPYWIGDSSGNNNNNLYSSGSGNQRKWYDNRAKDHCFYYATPIAAASGSRQISLITGFDASNFDNAAIESGTRLRIIIESDVVQVNRYPQYWGLYKLPWSNAATSASQMDPSSGSDPLSTT